MSPSISKSRYIEGLQCPKLLWHRFNAKAKIPQPDANQQAIFDQGTNVGVLAQLLFPLGITIDARHFEYAKVLDQSTRALASRKPLFEPGFQYKNSFARADILDPVGVNEWDVVEVKSSTDVKEVHLFDIAFQRWVYEGSGVKIRRCWILHIDNSYVRCGDIEPNKLFRRVDVTDRLLPLAEDIETTMQSMMQTIAQKEFPQISIGPQCSEPYRCPLWDVCWKDLPENNIFTLTRLGKKAFDLYSRGMRSVEDLGESVELTDNQQIQLEAVRHKTPHVNSEAIKAFLGTLRYPVFFLDFETLSTAVPLFDNVRPYQSIPFQFSLHVVSKDGGRPKHHAYLSQGTEDPRREILSLLKDLLGRSGSVVAYNLGFEMGRLRDAVTIAPEFASWLEELEPRTVDLYEPFRRFSDYHPDQHGSASLKAVLPALTGRTYADMEIGDGETASAEFVRVTFGDVTLRERRRVRGLLKQYCKLDTMAMIWIVDKLEEIRTGINPGPIKAKRPEGR